MNHQMRTGDVVEPLNVHGTLDEPNALDLTADVCDLCGQCGGLGTKTGEWEYLVPLVEPSGRFNARVRLSLIRLVRSTNTKSV
jgi:hypothetical protein